MATVYPLNIVKVNVTQTVGPAPATLQQSGALISQGATTLNQYGSALLTQLSDLTPLLAGTKAISTATWAGNLATITTAAPHGFTQSDTVFLTITGVSVAGFNGSFDCTVTGASTFTYYMATSLSSGTGGACTEEDVAELTQMATTFFAQGSNLACYVLELGEGSPADGITALGTYLTNYPNSNYQPGLSGYYYAYVVPRTWDGVATFLTLLASYESLTSKTYFFITTTLQTYTLYTTLQKCAFTLIESPAYGTWAKNTLTAATYTAQSNLPPVFTGVVTASTTTAHGVSPGQWFTISGCTPVGYNGTFQAQVGTTGSTLVYYVTGTLAAETVLGQLVGSSYSNTGVASGQFGTSSNEFSIAACFYRLLNFSPSAATLVPPFAYGFTYGTTPYPVQGNTSILTTLKNANINVISTGAEGGISTAMIAFGSTMDGNDFSYWYSVDWVQIQSDIALANAIINGSNNVANPLYYDQSGINTLVAVETQVMKNAVAFGLALAPITVTYIPFVQYVTQNPSDYTTGIYRGLSVSYTPQRGFKEIVFNVNVTNFPNLNS